MELLFQNSLPKHPEYPTGRWRLSFKHDEEPVEDQIKWHARRLNVPENDPYILEHENIIARLRWRVDPDDSRSMKMILRRRTAATLGILVHHDDGEHHDDGGSRTWLPCFEATAVCSFLDNYSAEVGRQLCVKRLRGQVLSFDPAPSHWGPGPLPSGKHCEALATQLMQTYFRRPRPEEGPLLEAVKLLQRLEKVWPWQIAEQIPHTLYNDVQKFLKHRRVPNGWLRKADA